jgi:hypothetical protein
LAPVSRSSSEQTRTCLQVHAEDCSDGGVPASVISDAVHSDFLSYPLRSSVIRMDDSYQFLGFKMFSGVVATSSCCFCREPLAL